MTVREHAKALRARSACDGLGKPRAGAWSSDKRRTLAHGEAISAKHGHASVILATLAKSCRLFEMHAYRQRPLTCGGGVET